MRMVVQPPINDCQILIQQGLGQAPPVSTPRISKQTSINIRTDEGTRTSIEIALCRLGISAHVAIGEKLANLSPTVLLEQFPQQTANFGSIRFLCG